MSKIFFLFTRAGHFPVHFAIKEKRPSAMCLMGAYTTRQDSPDLCLETSINFPVSYAAGDLGTSSDLSVIMMADNGR